MFIPVKKATEVT